MEKRDGYYFNYEYSDKFNGTKICLVFTREAKKEDFSYGGVLKSLLRRDNSVYKTLREVKIAKEELLIDLLAIKQRTFGNVYQLMINVAFPNEKFAEQDLSSNALKFIETILLKPKLVNGYFDKNQVDKLKREKILAIDSIKDDPHDYASLDFDKKFDPEGPISFSPLGEKEIYEEMDEKKLYDFYKSLLNDFRLEAYVVGDCSKEVIAGEIDKVFAGRKPKVDKLDVISSSKLVKKDISEYVIPYNTKQSVLHMGFVFDNLTERERLFVSRVFTLILDGPAGKLFKILREKHSLCYGVRVTNYSYNDKYIIGTSISASNYEKTRKLILEILNSMKKGDFDIEMGAAKNRIITSILEREDSLGALINERIFENLTKELTVDEEISSIKSVTKEEVINYAKKMNLDTIHFLKED